MFPKILNEIFLDKLTIDNGPELFSLIEKNRSYLREWLPWLDSSKSIDDTLVFIKESIEGYKKNQSLVLGIWCQKKLIGLISFHKFDWENRETSMGYWIDKDYQGKGYIKQACSTLIDYAFEKLHCEKIVISCAKDNTKSQAIPIRLGFNKTTTLHKKEWLYDHYVDHIIYEIDFPSWQSALMKK